MLYLKQTRIQIIIHSMNIYTMTVSEMEQRFEMLDKLYTVIVRFQRSCRQIHLLNLKMETLSKRHTAAKRERNLAFQNALRNRIMVVEGLLRVYGLYAKGKKTEILRLRSKLFGERQPVESDDEDSDDSVEYNSGEDSDSH